MSFKTAADVDPADPGLAVLTDRQREIVLARKTKTLQQIADEQRVTRARIRQIEQVALWKLRGPKAKRLRKT